MTSRFTQNLPEDVTVGRQIEFLVSTIDHMIKEAGWVAERGGDAVNVITARRLTRLLIATKERLQTIPEDADPEATWLPRDMQAMLWAISFETPIDFDEDEEDDE
jgi:hypothetical protein